MSRLVWSSLGVVLVLWQGSSHVIAQSSRELDEKTLESAGIPSDDKGLLRFFRNRSLKEADRPLVEELVQQLGSDVYKQRELASKDLLTRGPITLPFLKDGLKDAPLERVRRIEHLIKKIESTMGPEQPIAAARLLAVRNTPGAIEALLNFLPYANDEYVEEEVLGSLGALSVQEGRIDPVLQEALKDPVAARRAAAVYALGRRADLEQRAVVRQFLSDPDALVRTRASLGLTGKRIAQSLRDNIANDEKVLARSGIRAEEPALLDFLKKRTLQEEDQERLRQLIRDLGDPAYRVRARAQHLLIKEGTPAIAFLKPALESEYAEVSRRAALSLEEIKNGPGPALPTAVVRLLAKSVTERDSSPAAAIQVLLDYVPFADEESVEEEVFHSLTLLAAREVQVDALLPQALEDRMAARRAAAAVVLGRVGIKEHQASLRKALDDSVASVRLRAAQGLLAAGDRVAVPRLITLLNDLPAEKLWQVEDLLQRLAGDKAPTETLADTSTSGRQKLVRAWEKWWSDHGSRIDLARLSDPDSYLGLITVCEYDSAVGIPGGQVWEAGRDLRPRFTIKGVNGAMDAQVLPNGRVLVAENSANRITERDHSGAIKWEYRVPGNPVRVQRLPNGNTFIAMYNNVMEITPDQKVLYNVNRGPTFYIFSASKLRNGNVLAMTAQGLIMEFDPLTNKDVRSINVGPSGGWCSAEALPNGNYLVATMNNGLVREIDPAGKTLMTINYNGAFRATRLPNGNILVASMNTRGVAEFDRSGTKRWEKICQGRPWSVRYR